MRRTLSGMKHNINRNVVCGFIDVLATSPIYPKTKSPAEAGLFACIDIGTKEQQIPLNNN
jgi:hypothetical protein